MYYDCRSLESRLSRSRLAWWLIAICVLIVTSELSAARQSTIVVSCDMCVSIWLLKLHRSLLVAWCRPELTTATRCCMSLLLQSQSGCRELKTTSSGYLTAMQIWPRQTATEVSSLAACPTAHAVQNSSHHAQGCVDFRSAANCYCAKWQRSLCGLPTVGVSLCRGHALKQPSERCVCHDFWNMASYGRSVWQCFSNIRLTISCTIVDESLTEGLESNTGDWAEWAYVRCQELDQFRFQVVTSMLWCRSSLHEGRYFLLRRLHLRLRTLVAVHSLSAILFLICDDTPTTDTCHIVTS